MFTRTNVAAMVCTMALSQAAMAEMDPCMVGTWQADADAFGAALAATMGKGTATVTAGRIEMDVLADGTAFMDVKSVVIDTQPVGVPPSVIRMDGASSTQMTATGTDFWVEATEYNIQASAEVMGMVMDVPVAGTDPGSASGTYRCDGTQLRFDTDGPYPSIAPLWHRLD